MGEFASTINALVDAYNTNEEKHLWFKVKLADFKDRTRCKNVNIRGILKTVQAAELRPTTMLSITA